MGRESTRKLRRRLLMLADFSYDSGMRITAGAMRFASAHQGLKIVLDGAHPKNSDGDYAPESGIDGIVSCMGTGSERLRKALRANPRCPVVFAGLSREIATLGKRRTFTMLCDNAAISEAAAALFIRHDLTHFAYLGARPNSTENYFDRERREGYIRALAARGYAPAIYEPPPGSVGTDAELAALAAWLKGLPKPCGLFVSYDMRAMHALDVCRDSGIAVPEQLQVASVDNEEWICENVSPTLTSIEPDFEGCGRRAAEVLLRMMDGAEAGGCGTFGIKGIEMRMSTIDRHGSAARAVRARSYLRAHSAEKLDISDVATRLGCSPRLLQISYKTVYGRSMREDLSEIRFGKAKRLLADARIPVSDIAGRCGYDSPAHLMRLFKRRTGMTMLQWRRSLKGR